MTRRRLALVWLLCLALRVLILTEQRLRSALLKLSVRKPLTAPWVGPGAALGEWLRTKCEARGLPERVRARRRCER